MLLTSSLRTGELLGPEVAIHTTLAKAGLLFVEASENWAL
jgi:hypothetical protein